MRSLKPQFTWITLGVKGGLDESNLNAHLVAPLGSTDYISLDAGTLHAGLNVAIRNGCFSDIQPREGLSTEGTVLHHHIKAFLISHPYLDHCEGLVVVSPNNTKKPIMAIKDVISDIEKHLFNWRIWPNFGNRGTPPVLGTYDYVILEEGNKTRITGTEMNVEAYPLAHGEYTDSTAFLIESGGSYLLYMGDTGPDEVEKRTTTEDLWRRIAPIIKENRLHGIFIEASYPDERPDDQLFSHLTPVWMLSAFKKLAVMIDPHNPEKALEGLNVIIVHIKPDVSSAITPREIIERQLHEHNDLGLNFIFARQGMRYEL